MVSARAPVCVCGWRWAPVQRGQRSITAIVIVAISAVAPAFQQVDLT